MPRLVGYRNLCGSKLVRIFKYRPLFHSVTWVETLCIITGVHSRCKKGSWGLRVRNSRLCEPKRFARRSLQVYGIALSRARSWYPCHGGAIPPLYLPTVQWVRPEHPVPWSGVLQSNTGSGSTPAFRQLQLYTSIALHHNDQMKIRPAHLIPLFLLYNP